MRLRHKHSTGLGHPYSFNALEEIKEISKNQKALARIVGLSRDLDARAVVVLQHGIVKKSSLVFYLNSGICFC
jgi:hypothetical protein